MLITTPHGWGVGMNTNPEDDMYKPKIPAGISAAAFMNWGQPDNCQFIAEGIYKIDTPSHGGIVLSGPRLSVMPQTARSVGYGADIGAFEEDCAWCLPALAFWPDFKAWRATVIGTEPASYYGYARATALAWYPKIAPLLIKPQDRDEAEAQARAQWAGQRLHYGARAQAYIIEIDMDGGKTWESCWRDLPGAIALAATQEG